ncbi:MAG TPA: Gfo/Idh/MocA family oxidoreductase [Gemmataceae bacterium]|nr:Gfo/Idh/MocA family oxidoreductase [Gemmataceae bacterium]
MRYVFLLLAVSVGLSALADVHKPVQAADSKPTSPLKLGVVGLVHGHAAGFFRECLPRTDIQIVGIAESDSQLAGRYAKRYGLSSSLLFADIDALLQKTHPQAVVVYTNTFDHRSVVEKCAQMGIPVMMEKPLAVSVEDARAIEKAAQQGKIAVLVNYETTWYRSNWAAYDLVQEGALGEIRKLVVHDGHRGPKEIGVDPEFLTWLIDPKLNGGGALFDFGCYGADLATWLMDGRRPDTVTAVAQQLKPEIYSRVDDEATLILTYPKAQAIIQASWNWPFDRKDLEVYGQTGSVITVGRDDIRVRRGRGREELLAGKPRPASFANALSLLRAVVLDGAKADMLSSLETNVIVTEILDAARQSAAAGKTVSLKAPR